AVLWYWLQLIPAFVQCSIYKTKWSLIMFKNYLKTALRNIKRYKGYSFINMAGLSIGIASCLLILAYMNFEFSYDEFHSKSDRIYRFGAVGTKSGNDYNNALAPFFVCDGLMSNYPEVENAVRLGKVYYETYSYKNNKHFEYDFFYADNSIFSIFDFEFVKGDPESALSQPYSIVVTQETALKYFMNEDPIGKNITCDEQLELRVSGIIKKPPVNSHLQFDALVSMETLKKEDPYAAGDYFWTYVLLKNRDDVKTFKEKMEGFYDRQFEGKSEYSRYKLSVLLQPVTSIHLHSNLNNDSPGNANIEYIYGLIAAAILILLIACINFVNLSTVMMSKRAKEIGMRKVLGAFKRQITLQFFGESVLHVLAAFISGCIIVVSVFPYFQFLSGYNISINFLENPVMLLQSFLILLFISIAASGYSAIFLSGIRPIKTLKGKIIEKKENSKFRNVLVVFQFLISISLISITLGILGQLNYLKSKDLGFNKKDLIYLPVYTDDMNAEKVGNWVNVMKSEMLSLNGIKDVSFSGLPPVSGNFQKRPYMLEGIPGEKKIDMGRYNIENDFLNAMETDMIVSTGFPDEFKNGKDNSAVISESAAKLIGVQDPIGKILRDERGGRWKILGISKDFHCRSLHHNIDPVIFTNTEHYHYMIIRLKSGNIRNTLAEVKNVWDKFEPDHPFVFTFMDDKINSLYKNETNLGRIIQFFTILAVIISCLGIYGFISYITELRTKEIGIRKTFGATVISIVNMFVKNLAVWVISASIFAFPIGYFILNNWLRNFAYRIDLGLKIFAVSALSAFFVAFLTVIYQTIKAAIANPVDSLRNE
ncbi:ABC transporter permease, partial [candidate division KSB1 bacterium]